MIYPKVLGIWLGIIMYNGFVSGGDRHFMELIRYYPTNRFAVITTREGSVALHDYGINRKCVLVDFSFRNIICNPDVFSNFSAFVVYVILMLKAIVRVLTLPLDYEVVCASSHFLYDVLPATFARSRRKGCKLIVYNHMLMPLPFDRKSCVSSPYSLFTWIQQRISLLLIKRYADTVFVLPSEVAEVVKFGITPGKVRVMINGVDFDQIKKAKKLRYSYDGCFLARLSPYKGISDLVKIWAEVCRHLSSARIAVIGTERKKYIWQLRKLIHYYKLDKNFDILGALEDDQKYSVLKSSKIFVYPSRLESFGIVVVEAMACGVPIVAYDLPAYKIFGSHVIEKVPFGDIHSFARSVIRLLRNKQKRDYMSQRVKAASRQFGWKQAIEKDLCAFINR